ncbi:M10 family metallopeptidase C-terminal domain-containing protein [Pseudomonas paralactis]|uniref:M10 family metallopeptidase C-terminal domain-containing protein n=1 Tax=Pseudomonas paralactis TaxID=1615673 RepID=A0ABS0UWG2_9PSED|nr:M10 family metallopeptidase C-terminal domain-containing protein [Pseudomonas paralactis]MBI6632371.1 M10 family metallopeptidase C-terminal domain-containing protein [Pseudomonas paralactis]
MSSVKNNLTHRYGPSSYAERPRYAGAASDKPSYTTEQAAEQITRTGYRWKERNPDGTTPISYRFFTPSQATYNTPAGANEFSQHQKEQARRTLQSWADVANITFTENAPDAKGQLLLGNDPNQTGQSGHASYPGIYSDGTQAWFASDGVNRPFAQGSFSRYLLAHEIGHTLGLMHPGKYNNGGSYAENARYAEDNRAYSLMSYWWACHLGHDHNKNGQTHYASAPLMDDITPIQKLYGANYKTRDTDTVYGFNSNTGRDFLSLNSPDDAPVFSVWDGGGTDTLDFSGFHQAQTINLKAEHFSDVGGMKGNVSIAKGVTLENAIGGTGADQLIGNHADNRLTGGLGQDILTGGPGKDTFVYNNASESTEQRPDLITDFTSGEDRIDVSAALRAAGLKDLHFVRSFSGRPGEALLGYDPRSGHHSLAIDLNGAGQADLFINSQGPIKPGDVISQASHASTAPTPPFQVTPQPPTPAKTAPYEPRHEPMAVPQQAPFSLQNHANASLKGTPMHTAARAVGSIREVSVTRDSWGYERVHTRSLGTGSLINDGNSVLTNQHVRDALAKGSKLELWLGYEQDSTGRMKVERKVPLDPTPLSGDARLDYAELRVDLPGEQKKALAEQFPPLKLAAGPQASLGQKVFMPNHGQEALGISFLNAWGQPTTLKGYDQGSPYQGTVYHDAFKKPGTSGSPLISIDTGEIVALHNGSIGANVNGHRASMGTATRIDLIQQHRRQR